MYGMKLRTLARYKGKRDMNEIVVIQLSGKTYFWVLKKNGKVIASSRLIAEKNLVVEEAISIGGQFGLEYSEEERE